MQEFRLHLPNGIVITSELSEEQVSMLPDLKRDDKKNGYVWYTLPPVEINHEELVFSLCFFNSAIQSFSFSVSNPELYGAGWNDFSEVKEKARANATEKWLSSIGYRTGKYSWGCIWAGYDSKGGWGHASVRFAL